MYLILEDELIDLDKVERISKTRLNHSIQLHFVSGIKYGISFETVEQQDKAFNRFMKELPNIQSWIKL